MGSRSFPFCQALALITIEIPDPFRRSDSNRAIPIAAVQSFQLGSEDFLDSSARLLGGNYLQELRFFPNRGKRRSRGGNLTTFDFQIE